MSILSGQFPPLVARIHVRVRVFAHSMCPATRREGPRIRRHRVYIVRPWGNCGNDDDGSVRLESEMLPGARDACPNPLKLLGASLSLPLSLSRAATPEALALKRSYQWCFHSRIRCSNSILAIRNLTVVPKSEIKISFAINQRLRFMFMSYYRD